MKWSGSVRDLHRRCEFSVRRQRGFTTIALVSFAALYLPIFVLVIFAFNSASSLSHFEGVSLRWFIEAAGNQQVIDATLLSFKVASIAAVIATVVATMAALATTRTGHHPGLTFKYAVLNAPLMIPEIVTAVALLIVFSQVKGWTGYTGLGYLIIAHTAFCIPFAYLPIRARLEGMDLTLETAAADLYAGPWATFRYITLPLLLPGIFAGMMLAFVTSLDDVVITVFIKSAGQDTLPTYMLGQIRRQVTPEINAISTALLLLTVALLTLFFLLTRKKT